MLQSIIQVLLSGICRVTKSRDSMPAFALCALVCATVIMFTSQAGAYTYTYSDANFTGSFQVSGTDVGPTGLIDNLAPGINQDYTLVTVYQPWSNTAALTVGSYSITGLGYTFSMATDPLTVPNSVVVSVNHAGQIVDWSWTIYDGAPWPAGTLAQLVLYGGPHYSPTNQENLYIEQPYSPHNYTNPGTWTGSSPSSPSSKIGVFRNGQWYIDLVGTYTWSGCGPDGCYGFGTTGDIPVMGNWNGSADGKSKIGIFRNGTWYLDYSGTYAATGIWAGCGAPTDPTKAACIPYGASIDIPVVGNWNGSADGKSKIGIFRNGTWYLDYSGTYAATGIWAGCGAPTDPTKAACIAYGIGSDVPVVGNWNDSADGKSKIGVFRNGMWYVDYPGTYEATGTWAGCGAPTDPTKEVCAAWGAPTDIPLVFR